MPHIGDQTDYLNTTAFHADQTYTSLEYQGRYLAVKRHAPQYIRKRTGKRGKITGFSRAQRLACLKKLAIWDWEAIKNSLFVTLTYSDTEHPAGQKERNKHRYLWHRYVENHFGHPVPALWRVEYKPRKSGQNIGQYYPHWHFLLLGERWLEKELVREFWQKSTGTEENKVTEIKGAKKHEAVGMYIAKYLSKDAVDISLVYASKHNNSGRHYGVLRQKLIPLCDRIEVPKLTDNQVQELTSLASEKLPWLTPEIAESFTLLGSYAKEIYSHFVNNLLDIGQTIAENDEVKGESPAKSVTRQDSAIGTPAGTFFPARLSHD